MGFDTFCFVKDILIIFFFFFFWIFFLYIYIYIYIYKDTYYLGLPLHFSCCDLTLTFQIC